MEITVKGYDVAVPDDFTSWDAPAQNALLDEIEAEIDTNVRTEDKAAYDALPWYEQAATAAGDVGTLAVKGAMDLGAGAVNLGGNALGYTRSSPVSPSCAQWRAMKRPSDLTE